jgi:hypothetical protein
MVAKVNLCLESTDRFAHVSSHNNYIKLRVWVGGWVWVGVCVCKVLEGVCVGGWVSVCAMSCDCLSIILLLIKIVTGS